MKVTSFKLRMLALPAILLLPCLAAAQTYNFSHYDIDDGLVQSQVQTIYQDRQHYLWFGSLGGLSRFDGKEFTSYSKADGLGKSIVTSILQDRSGRMLLGSENGVSSIYNGQVANIPSPGSVSGQLVRNLVEDAAGTLWMTIYSRLFTLRNDTIRPSAMDGRITALRKSPSGKVYAAVIGRGIFAHNGKRWERKFALSDSLIVVRDIIFDRGSEKTLYLLTSKKILKASAGAIAVHPIPAGAIPGDEAFSALEQDAEGNLWLGTNTGAWWLRNNRVVHFNSSNGFTNAPVRDIFRDAEDNMWIATDGAGVFRFDGGLFVTYQNAAGPANLVMSMTRDRSGNLWMATTNSSVIRYDGRGFQTFGLPNLKGPYGRTVMSIHCEPGGAIYAGTYSGLFRFDGSAFKIYLPGFGGGNVVKGMVTDRYGTLWLASGGGCYYLSQGKPVRITGLDQRVDALVEAGKDSLIAATSTGLVLIKGKTVDRGFLLRSAENSTILSLLQVKGIVLAGTFGDGLMAVDPRKQSVRIFNMKNGLSSNDIYSLAADAQGMVWAGTGRGVNRFRLDPATAGVTVAPGLPAVLFEGNQNAIASLGDKVWFGTTKGLYAFDAKLKGRNTRKPFITLQSVRIESQERGKASHIREFTAEIPDTLQLSYNQTRIIISFMGIYMTEPDDVAYQYRLRGQGEEFSQPEKTNIIEFSALLPGTYTFEVRAVTPNGAVSPVRALTFIIVPPFYQTIWFRVLAILFIVALVIGVQYYWTWSKARRKRVLAQIKQEEQQRIRQETAEDFHDDIGNKLTRIAVLSDLLSRYIPEGQSEQRELVNQIKGNADTLYKGTKDILWALDPQSDNIGEILNYSCRLGNEIFFVNNIRFDCTTEGAQLQRKLPMKYSRNISMLLKECFHNILKHAAASEVLLRAVSDKDSIRIAVSDNGKGFAVDAPSSGRGLNNMRVRAKRLNARLTIDAAPGQGTRFILDIPLRQADQEYV